LKKLCLTLLFLFMILSLSAQSLSDGWYLYSFKRQNRNSEMEEQYRAMGIESYMESRESYSAIPVELIDGAFIDPTLLKQFILMPDGRVESSLTSMAGSWEGGEMQWTAQKNHWGYNIEMSCQAFLKPIDSDNLAPASLNGSYLIRHGLTGREMVVNLTDGYLLFEPVVRTQEDEYFQGWPLLVQADGSFYSRIDIETIVKMNYQVDPNFPGYENPQADSVTTIIVEGNVNRQEGLVMEMYQSDSVVNERAGDLTPLVYGGLKLSDHQLAQMDLSRPQSPQEQQGQSQEQTSVNWDSYPQWYLNPQAPEGGLVYAACYEGADQQRALQLAETKAVAGLAFQIQVDLNTSFQDYSKTNGQGDVMQEYFESRLQEVAFSPVSYRIQQSYYDAAAQRAYVIAEMTMA
jgi:hypothetical protein